MIQSKLLATCFAISIIGVTSFAYAESITYKNQRNSTLTLTLPDVNQTNGTITGTFTTAVSECKKEIGVPQPISGYVNGNVIAFVVSFPHCKSIAALTGHLSKDMNDLNMTWLVNKQAGDPQHQDWQSTITGHDQFKKVVS